MITAALLYNPASGAKKGQFSWLERRLGIQADHAHLSQRERVDWVTTYLSDHDIKVTLHPTTSKQHARSEAATLARSTIDCLLVMGGDGTIHDVIQSTYHQDMPIGIIPTGTANILARSLALPLDLKGACDVIINQHITHVGVGCCGNTIFACMVGLGFDAKVIAFADRFLKKSLGVLGYAFSFVFNLLGTRHQKFTIQCDDNTVTSYWTLITNVKYYGGHFVLHPTLKPDPNSPFYVISLTKGSLGSILRFCWCLWRHCPDQHPDVQVGYSTTVSLTEGSPPCHCDAETTAFTPLKRLQKPMRVFGVGVKM